MYEAECYNCKKNMEEIAISEGLGSLVLKIEKDAMLDTLAKAADPSGCKQKIIGTILIL